MTLRKFRREILVAINYSACSAETKKKTKQTSAGNEIVIKLYMYCHKYNRGKKTDHFH